MQKPAIDTKKTMCFTGRRPKNIIPAGPYLEANRPEYQKIVDRLTERISQLYDLGFVNFISGGAQGFDQLTFWAVNNVKRQHPEIQNIVYKPFDGQELRWAKTGLFSQHEYKLMIDKADAVYTCVKDLDTSDYKNCVKALMYRNECMVDDSSYVLGMYPDDSYKDKHTKGGTAACLRYALKKHKTIELFA